MACWSSSFLTASGALGSLFSDGSLLPPKWKKMKWGTDCGLSGLALSRGLFSGAAVRLAPGDKIGEFEGESGGPKSALKKKDNNPPKKDPTPPDDKSSPAVAVEFVALVEFEASIGLMELSKLGVEEAAESDGVAAA